MYASGTFFTNGDLPINAAFRHCVLETLLMFIASQIWSSAAQRHFNNKKQQKQYPDILKRKENKGRGCKDNFK